MKKIKNLFMFIILVLPFLITNGSALLVNAEESDELFQNGGNVYDDLTGNYGILGIASQFHIFAKGTTKLSTHTNGNIATNNFEGNTNFGTNIHEGLVSKDINYLKNIQAISSSSGVQSTSTRSNKFVVGVTNTLSLVDNGSAVAINGTKMDHLQSSEVYQDSTSTNYIDFDNEFSKLENVSTELSTKSATQTVTNSSFQDINNRVINIPDTTGPISINIDEIVLEQSTPLTINNPNNVVIVMNVINGEANQNVASQIKYNGRSNHETEDFSDANIFWNFGNKVSTLNINAPFQGTVLAPNATINANQNLDGSIIGTNVNINAESHRWDPNPIILDNLVEETGSVILIKTDSEDAKKVLSGAEFGLYKADTDTLINTYTTGEDGTFEVKDLALGNYYFVETKAPTGYELNKDKHEFKIEAGKTATAVTVNVSDVKTKESISKTDNSNSKNNSSLPKTGETANIAFYVLGSFMVLVSGLIFKKRN